MGLLCGACRLGPGTHSAYNTSAVESQKRGKMSASGECCRANFRDCIDISHLLVLQVAELQQGSVGQLQAELRQSQAAATDLAQRMANLQNQVLTDAGG